MSLTLPELVAALLSVLGALIFLVLSRRRQSTTVTELWRFPVKSCKGEKLLSAEFDPLGLQLDRRWMVINDTEKMITSRDCGQLVQIVASVSASPTRRGDGSFHHELQLKLTAPGMPELSVPSNWDREETVKIWSDAAFRCGVFDSEEVSQWLQKFLDRACRLAVILPEGRHSRPLSAEYDTLPRADGIQSAFHDEGFPLLIASEESLKATQKACGPEITMLNFRPNIVVKGCRAFEEDSWVRIRIGKHIFNCVKPCDRCIVTTIDPQTGKRNPSGEPLISLRKIRGTNPLTGVNDGGKCYFGIHAIHTDPNTRISIGDAIEVLERRTVFS